MSKAYGIAGVAALLLTPPALGHHSFAMFDADKTVEVQGTVKELQWTNPHSWLQVIVKDAQGQSKEWSFEMSSPGGLSRQGWKPKIVVPGDRVTVKMHPRKDGSSSGQLLAMTLPNGQTLGNQGGN